MNSPQHHYEHSRAYCAGWALGHHGYDLIPPRNLTTDEVTAFAEGWNDARQGDIDAWKYLGKDFVLPTQP